MVSWFSTPSHKLKTEDSSLIRFSLISSKLSLYTNIPNNERIETVREMINAHQNRTKEQKHRTKTFT